MKTSDNERIKYEITGQAVLQILRMKINFSLQTLIKQLLVMKSAEELSLFTSDAGGELGGGGICCGRCNSKDKKLGNFWNDGKSDGIGLNWTRR